METVELLTLVPTLLVFLAIFLRSTKRSLRAPAKLQQLIIKVRDPAVVRSTLIDQADAFLNRPSTPFPVPLITRSRRRSQSHGVTTVPYGPQWRALRCNLTAAILNPWRLGLLAPLQREAVQALVTSLRDHGAGDVVIRDNIYTALFGLLTRLCFGDGVNPSHVQAMQRMMQEFRVAIGKARDYTGSMLTKLVHWRRWRRFLAFRDQQAALFLPLIAARRRQSPCDNCNGGGVRPYVDSLIDLRVPSDDGSKGSRALTDDEIVSLVVEFFGGAEAVTACVEWTLAHLVNHPEIQRKLRHELTGEHVDGLFSDEGLRRMPYLNGVLLESLRLHPPFPLILRDVSTEGAVVGNETAPPGGMRVCFILKDIGRDRKTWTHPDEFRPERFLAGGEGEGVSALPGTKEIKMMPFGAGPRSCPGAGLGILYMKCFLAALVRKFEWAPPVKSCGVSGVDMTELFGFITVMKTPLSARVTRATFRA